MRLREIRGTRNSDLKLEMKTRLSVGHLSQVLRCASLPLSSGFLTSAERGACLLEAVFLRTPLISTQERRIQGQCRVGSYEASRRKGLKSRANVNPEMLSVCSLSGLAGCVNIPFSGRKREPGCAVGTEHQLCWSLGVFDGWDKGV